MASVAPATFLPMTDNAGQAPPGWYPDPSGAPRHRYFDGELWTDQYREDALPTGVPAAGGYVTQGRHPVGLTDPGSLLSDAWGAVRARIGPLLGLTVGFGIALAVLYGLFFAWIASRVDNVSAFDDFGDTFAEFIVAYLLFLFLVGLVYSAYILVSTRMLHLEHRGQHASIGVAWQKAKSRLWAFYGTAIMLYIGFYIGTLILAFILVAVAPPLIFLVFVPMVYAWVKWGFLPIAAVATNKGDAMVSESVAVSTGRFWAIFGRMLMVSLPLIGMNILAFIIAVAAGDSSSAGPAVLIFVVALVGGLLGGLIMASGLTKLYLDAGGSSDI